MMRFSAFVLFSFSLSPSAKASPISSEEIHSNPHMLDFNEKYTNTIMDINDDFLTTLKEESDIPEQFALFYNNSPKPPVLVLPVSDLMPAPSPGENSTVYTSPSILPFTTPTSLFGQTTLKRKLQTLSSPTTTLPSLSSKTLEYQVLPIKNSQRGILDVIFPPSRVSGFKKVFETFRRILSSTFRK